MKVINRNNGKEYVYDYVTVNLHSNQHKAIRELAKKHKASIGDMIIKLIRHYDKDNL